ncbi:isopenicillin N synthase family dioxygenase [Thalassomonas actiniarum]|uniref:2-oxoglutarate-dependent ethylene/succinate-forming enzyme n=1 Tax=Thalassomonas actiniarum TaxID=485447 RepID=A0AAF0C1R1_9GAMM|nr:2-oxoglutarate and iron-dependent oxygenase domain-containing protein [Thalassomonas actiniarum]WDD97208.1 isopenicillin N synthase family oxygenase [Thalassomonas actiniarum]
MIPKIDIKDRARDRIADEISRHCRQVGFFAVTGHGLEQGLINELFAVSRDFFGSEQKEKDAVSLSEFHRGYARVGAEKIDPYGPEDFRETYLMGWESPDEEPLPQRIPFLGPNNWPAGNEYFQQVLLSYYHSVMQVAQFLLECFALTIGQAADFFKNNFKAPLSNLVLAHYPVLENAPRQAMLGCGEHTDYGLITLLLHDGNPGLQVKTRQGQWLSADASADDLIVNVGDMMEFISGGKYISNPHRVEVMRHTPRTSIPFFVQPDYEALIKPVLVPFDEAENTGRWKPRLAGAYLEERIAQSFISDEQKLILALKSVAGPEKRVIKNIAELLKCLSLSQ